MTTASAPSQTQVEVRSGASGEPGRLRTIASSEAGGGSMRGTSKDSGESSCVAGGGGK
jgi:hypothetical protein